VRTECLVTYARTLFVTITIFALRWKPTSTNRRNGHDDPNFEWSSEDDSDWRSFKFDIRTFSNFYEIYNKQFEKCFFFSNQFTTHRYV